LAFILFYFIEQVWGRRLNEPMIDAHAANVYYKHMFVTPRCRKNYAASSSLHRLWK